MPTVSVDKNHFFEALGRPEMSIEEFEEICFDFGVELDEVTSEREIASKEGQSAKSLEKLSNNQILKIDVSANRYDLLCEEGLVKSLKVFLGNADIQDTRFLANAKPSIVVKVTKATLGIRPFIVCAVLRDVKMDNFVYESLIDLQEKLHNGLCRRRTKVAIGTHDLDKLSGNVFRYDALPPNSIRFQPLNQSELMDGSRLMEFYQQDRKLSKFLPIIRDSPVYPVVFDQNQNVLSLPPIINGNMSKITLDTRNIFIECTGTDLTKAKNVLNIIVGMFSQYCKIPYTVEPVLVEHEGESPRIYPDLSPRKMTASVDYINSCIGRNISLDSSSILGFLMKMGMNGSIIGEGSSIQVDIPSYRTDVLHPCDIMEDVAIAYGINKILKTVPPTSTVGAAFSINKMSDFVRKELSFCGWSEVLTLTLCSLEENYDHLRKENPGNEAVELENPQTIEYQVVRTSLIPGILKTINANKKSKLPIQIFEVGDIVVQDNQSDNHAKNIRHVCAMYSNKNSGLELIHGLLDRLMAMINISDYSIEESSHPTFFPGRQAQIFYKGKNVGYFGIIHPEVLKHFDLDYPVSCFELDLEELI